MNMIILPNLISVYYEQVGEIAEEYAANGFRSTEKLICAWSSRHLLAQQIMGTTTYNGSTVTRRLPRVCPTFEQAVPTGIAITPLPEGQTLPDTLTTKAWISAILTVTYETPTYDQGFDNPKTTYITEAIEPQAEFLTLSNRTLYWDAGKTQPLSTDEAPGYLLRMIDWVYIYHQMPYIPLELLTLIGCVNNSSIRSITTGLEFPAETLLFTPPSIRREITSMGATAWEIVCRFSYRPTGWNKFPQAGNIISFLPIYDSNGEVARIYTPADFTQIIAQYPTI